MEQRYEQARSQESPAKLEFAKVAEAEREVRAVLDEAWSALESIGDARNVGQVLEQCLPRLEAAHNKAEEAWGRWDAYVEDELARLGGSAGRPVGTEA